MKVYLKKVLFLAVALSSVANQYACDEKKQKEDSSVSNLYVCDEKKQKKDSSPVAPLRQPLVFCKGQLDDGSFEVVSHLHKGCGDYTPDKIVYLKGAHFLKKNAEIWVAYNPKNEEGFDTIRVYEVDGAYYTLNTINDTLRTVWEVFADFGTYSKVGYVYKRTDIKGGHKCLLQLIKTDLIFDRSNGSLHQVKQG